MGPCMIHICSLSLHKLSLTGHPPFLLQQVTTRMQHLNVANSTGATDVDKRKQRSAFPPNYIHCLDSAHMMMTADACNKANITFASMCGSF